MSTPLSTILPLTFLGERSPVLVTFEVVAGRACDLTISRLADDSVIPFSELPSDERDSVLEACRKEILTNERNHTK